MRSLWLRLRSYWRRQRLARDFEDEMAFHLETRRDRLIAAGATPEEADLQARRAFGSPLRTGEALRDVWTFRWFDDLWRDLGFASRTFVKNPVFALAAVCSLALGIGAATAIYTAAYAMLWRPMPVESPERLVAMYQTGPNGLEDFRGTFSYPELLDYGREVNEFTDVMGSTGVPLRVTGANRPELVWGQVVTENFFSGLRVRMAAGRGFLANERAPVAVVSYAFWQRRFHGDAQIVGRTIEINGHALTIVGVTARGFSGTQMLNYVPDVSIPVRLQPVVLPSQGNWFEDRTNRWITARGRLRPGVSLGQAEAGMNVVGARLGRQYTENRGLTVHVIPGATRTNAYLVASGAIAVIATVVGGAVVLLLLIACTNVANLMLARSASRSREMATRVAIGAGRGRLVRQVLTEGLLLALAGGAVGLLVARLLNSVLWGFYPTLDFMTADIDYDSAVDASAYLFTLGVSVVTALLFSLGPALRASKVDQMSAIRGRRPRFAPLLVAAQVALSLVLLVAGGLFLRSLQYAQTIDPGFDRHGLLVFMIDLDLQDYPRDRGLSLQRELARRLQSVPGVTSAAVASPMPLGPEDESFRFRVFGYTPRANESMTAGMTCAGPGYFQTVGTRLVAGREIREGDNEGAPRVVVVNETFARRFWQSPEKAVGQRLGFSDSKDWVQIVGVARDGKYSTFGETPQPYAFFPIQQQYRGRATVALRTREPLESVLTAVRRQLHALDPELPVLGMKTIGQYLERLLSIYQMGAVLLGLFAFCALLLSSVGLFGLLHFNVTRQTREIGIRMALGAAGRGVALSILGSALRLVGIGLLIGLVGSLAVSGLLSQVVAGVSGSDPITYVVVVLLILIVGAAAALLPARRAAAVDPVRALHWE